jgi:hypothetical protein
VSTSVPAPLQDKLLLLPYARALEQLGGSDVRIAMVTPPYPCAGVGELRVVRVSETDGSVRLDLSYDHYERLE